MEGAAAIDVQLVRLPTPEERASTGGVVGVWRSGPVFKGTTDGSCLEGRRKMEGKRRDIKER